MTKHHDDDEAGISQHVLWNSIENGCHLLPLGQWHNKTNENKIIKDIKISMIVGGCNIKQYLSLTLLEL